MANFVITYDLDGLASVFDKEMDDHLRKLVANRAESWRQYGGSPIQSGCGAASGETILGQEDLLLVIEATSAAWTKLLCR
ncbi:MAG: hypothetical protein R3E51_19495 [Rhizobiaceae bacterium]